MTGSYHASQCEGNRRMAMLIDRATEAIAAIDALDDALDHAGHDTIEHLRTLALEASEPCRVLIDELHETFVAPLEREDICNFAQCYEKAVVDALTKPGEMHLLQLTADEPIRRIVALVHGQAQDLRLAIRPLAKHRRVVGEHANRVLQKEREVCRQISNMAERAVSAANVLGSVVMKIA